MSQEEVLDLLEEAREPLSAGEVAKRLNDKESKISVIIAKLLKHQEIKCLEINRMLAKKFYGSKRAMRIYYV